MEQLMVKDVLSTISVDKNIKEFKLSPIVIASQFEYVKTANLFWDNVISDSSCNNPDEFKIVVGIKYPKFKQDMLAAIRETPIESGVHYYFEDKFNEYFEDNKHMAAQLLQRFLRENYTNIKVVKAILHIVSHYNYDEIGDDFTFPISSLLHHENKGIRKFALKVFDNWDSAETLSVLKGTDVMKERWLNDYKIKIIERLERKMINAVFFACY